MEIAQAYIQVLPTTDGIGASLTQALTPAGDAAGEAAGKSAGGKLVSALGGAAKIGAAAVGAIAAGTSAAGAAAVKAAGDVAAYGDNIDKMSQKMGISAKVYQEWDAVLQHSGTSIESMKMGFKTLTASVTSGTDESKKAWAALGISIKDAQKMTAEQRFDAAIAGLQGVGDETQRAALANTLLGRSALELGPLLNTSAEDTQKMKDRVNELGGVMSDDAVKASAAYQDSLQDMQTAISGAGRTIVSNFLPSLTTVMDGIGSIFSGDSETGIGQVSAGVDGIITTITEKTPEVAAVGGEIISAVGTAITENLPSIMDAGTQILLMIVTGLITGLPGLIESATLMVTTVVEGINQALPTLIPAALDAVLTVAEGLVQNAPQLISSAITLMVTLGTGLVNGLPQVLARLPAIITGIVNALVGAAPQLMQAGVTLLTAIVRNLPAIISGIVRAVPQIISGIVSAFTGAIGQMVTVGSQLLAGIGRGLIQGVKGVINSAKEAAGQVLGAIKGFFGIHSPSWITRGFGLLLDEGLGVGITRGVRGVVTVAKGAVGQVLDALTPNSKPVIDIGVAVDRPELELSGAAKIAKAAAANAADPRAAAEQNEAREIIRLLGELIRIVDGKRLVVDGQSLAMRLTPIINSNLGEVAAQQEREVYV